ncbi:hypothetical protein ACWC4C_38605 [Streptomyces olivaceoviridis]
MPVWAWPTSPTTWCGRTPPGTPPTKRSPHPAPGNTAALRRRLLLSVRLWWHPYWQTIPSVPAARSELRQPARARGAVQAA